MKTAFVAAVFALLASQAAAGDADGIILERRQISRDSFGISANALRNNDVAIGFSPDNGDVGNPRQLPSSLKSAVGRAPATIGLYAHLRGDTGAAFTCAELLDIGGSQTTGFASHYGRGVKNANQVSGYSKGALFNDVVKAKESVLIATVLPLYGFRGVRNGDNANAVRLAKCLKRFTDAGVPVWLRYGPEASYYQSDESRREATLNGQRVYAGSVSQWKASYRVVAAAVRANAPKVKLVWGLGLDSVETASAYNPGSSNYDILSVAAYDVNSNFGDAVQAVHDQFTSSSKPLLIETSQQGTQAAKQRILKAATQAADQLSNLRFVNWFNFKSDGYSSGCGQIVGGCASRNAKSFFASLE